MCSHASILADGRQLSRGRAQAAFCFLSHWATARSGLVPSLKAKLETEAKAAEATKKLKLVESYDEEDEESDEDEEGEDEGDEEPED